MKHRDILHLKEMALNDLHLKHPKYTSVFGVIALTIILSVTLSTIVFFIELFLQIIFYYLNGDFHLTFDSFKLFLIFNFILFNIIYVKDFILRKKNIKRFSKIENEINKKYLKNINKKYLNIVLKNTIDELINKKLISLKNDKYKSLISKKKFIKILEKNSIEYLENRKRNI